MSKFIGKRANVGIGKEVTPGLAVTPTHWIPCEEKSPNISVEYVPNESDYGVIHDTVGSEPVYSKGEPEIKGLVFDKSMGLFLMAAFGSVSTGTGVPEAGVNTHTFSILNSESHPSYTIAFKDINQDYCFAYSKLQSLNINFASKALTKFEAKFVSQAKEADTNTAAYSTTENHFNSSMATFKYATNKAGLGAGTTIPLENINIKIEKEIIEQESLGSLEPTNIYNGLLKVEMEFEALMDNTTLQAMNEAGTSIAAQVALVNAGVTIGLVSHPSLTITLNQINLEKMDFGYKNKDIVRQKFTGKAHYKLSEAEAIQAVLVNTETSY
jgi:hypothetical protein